MGVTALVGTQGRGGKASAGSVSAIPNRWQTPSREGRSPGDGNAPAGATKSVERVSLLTILAVGGIGQSREVLRDGRPAHRFNPAFRQPASRTEAFAWTRTT